MNKLQWPIQELVARESHAAAEILVSLVTMRSCTGSAGHTKTRGVPQTWRLETCILRYPHVTTRDPLN